MSDRELLELAAKAAGYPVRWYEDSLAYGQTFGIEVEPGNPCGFEVWNPLEDDGDALRLAVKLNIEISPDPFHDSVYCEPKNNPESTITVEALDAFGVRRAIVRAAAEIGRAIP
ncbi:hypothetical protein VPH49_09720 [Pseudomonas luteola]|uniref:hypothetical protein n=1 Tax=Pseudomonas luteola TaxID=47886 RepID=UPI003A84CB24